MRSTSPSAIGSAELTVVVPTRNERDNVSILIERLERVCPDLQLEILFVDDSTDDTPAVIRERARRSSRRVTVIHRPRTLQVGGLGGAVLLGLSAAGSEWVCVMDGDLQHPPELLDALVDEGRGSNADIVVASRYCTSGDVGEFSILRRSLSRGSTFLALALFPRRLHGVSDPMSGFFLLRRAAVDFGRLRPRGFKILLEILLSAEPLATSEVAFRFGERHAGESKASLREGVRYLLRLIELRIGHSLRASPSGAREATRRDYVGSLDPVSVVRRVPTRRSPLANASSWNSTGTNGRHNVDIDTDRDGLAAASRHDTHRGVRRGVSAMWRGDT
jgi:dolichol-phosphate mannosyltransferase